MTKAVFDGEDWVFTEIPLEVCPNWRGTTCFSTRELGIAEGCTSEQAIAALEAWLGPHKEAKRLAKKADGIFFFEVTDTFAGEANYSWTRRYKVHAATLTGALRKFNKLENFHRLVKYQTGPLVSRWGVPGACIAIFGREWHEFTDCNYMNVKELT